MPSFTLRFIFLFAVLALMHPTLGAPASFQKQNALDAQKLNAQFAGLKASDSCTDGQSACVEGSFAQCVGSAWTLKSCGSDLTCFALPLVAKPGTSLTCDTESDAIARMQAAGADASLTGSNPSNTSKASQSAKVSASAHVRAVTLPSSGANAINRSSAFGASTAPSPAVTTPTVNSRASELRKRQQLSSSVDFSSSAASSISSSSASTPVSVTSAPTPSSSATPDCNGCEEDCDTGHGVSVVTVVVTTTVFATVTAAPTGTLSVTSAAFQSASSVIISSTASPSASAAASSADSSSAFGSATVSNSFSSPTATGFPTATTGFPVATSSGSSVAESIASTDFGSASSNPVLQASPTSVVSDASGSASSIASPLSTIMLNKPGFTSIVVASPTSVVASFAPTPSVTPAPNNIILPTDSAAIASMITATVN
ncbi:unnamed protein product [Somion occarium]|uniref:Carbohydrate-binding module family 19 domain-containing protein n=1 Tax=Somion occarium TaxID=3059160 RepID=A0ABP1DM43_9APHY